MHHIYGVKETWLDELCSSNPLRIPHPKFDKLACQTQGVGIFANGEITLRDAYCEHFIKFLFYKISEKFWKETFSTLSEA